MMHRTFGLALLMACVATIVAIIAMPNPEPDMQSDLSAEMRRERAEARMCIESHGVGVSVIRDIEGRTVCVPRHGR